MRIEEIRVDGYGHLTRTHLTVADGFVCVDGPNEAGKSTLLAFVRGVLFGFKSALTKASGGADLRSAPYDPTSGGRKGGSLTVRIDEKDGETRRYRFTRIAAGRKDGDLVIRDETSGVEMKGEDAERLRRQILGHIDTSVFNAVFAIGTDELHAVDTLDEESVHAVLFTADAGIASGLAKEMEDLKKAAETLYKKGGSKQKIADINRQLKELAKARRKASDEIGAYRAEREAYTRVEEEQKALQAQQDALHGEKRRAERRHRLRSLAARRDQVEKRLLPLQERLLPDEDDREQHSALIAACRAAEKERKNAEARHAEAVRALEAVRFDPKDAEAWTVLRGLPLQELETVVGAAREAARLERLLADAPDRPVGEDASARFEKTLEQITETGHVIAGIEAKEEEAKKTLVKCRSDMLDAGTRSLLERAVRVDLEKTRGDTETTARRRASTADAHDDALARIGDDWTPERLARTTLDASVRARVGARLPHASGRPANGQRNERWPSWAVGGLLVALGVLGLLGPLAMLGPVAAVVLLAAGLLVVLVPSLRRPATLPEARGAPDAAAIKVLHDIGLPADTVRGDFDAMVTLIEEARRTASALHQAEEDHQRASARHDAAVAQVQETAVRCGVTPADDPQETQARLQERLATAQRLEGEADAARRHLETLTTERKASGSRLARLSEERDRLLEEALPPELRTDDTATAVARFRALAEASRKADLLRDKIERLSGETARYDAIREAFAAAQSLRGAEMPEDDRFMAVVHSTVAMCRTAAEQAEEARRLGLVVAEAEDALVRRRKEEEAAHRALSADLARFGCQDEVAFTAAVKEAQHRAELEGSLRQVDDEVATLIAEDPSLHGDEAMPSPEEDDALLAGFDDRLEALKTRFEEARQESRELYAKLRKVMDQDDLSRILQQEERLEEERRERIRDWVESALTWHLLDQARKRYEREHGPRVLQVASQILHHVTAGRYVQILRSFEGAHYELETADGERLPAVPPHLSRGAFAQVYLAIRLAYAQVNDDVRAPYVLDDVLSDFDDDRLDAALAVLRQLSTERQVLLFTHHEHVRRAAERHGAVHVRLGEGRRAEKVPAE